jgi:hypothetical protein
MSENLTEKKTRQQLYEVLSGGATGTSKDRLMMNERSLSSRGTTNNFIAKASLPMILKNPLNHPSSIDTSRLM